MGRLFENNIDHVDAEKNLSILIVDDEETITDILSKFAAISGFQADVSMTGGEAILQVQTKEYDLVLLDVNLPDIEGIELITKIQAIHPDIKIVIMTGENNRERELQARQHNIAYYLVKPFSYEEIRAVFIHVEKKMQQGFSATSVH